MDIERHEPSNEPPRRRRRAQVPLYWALPAILFALAMHYVAVGAGAWYAFTDWNGLSSARWIGLSNFRDILGSADARGALRNTVELAVVFVVVVNAIGLSLALALNRTVKSRSLLRAVFFAPVVVMPVAIAFVWQFIFQYDGPLNRGLGAVGLQSWEQAWIGDPRWALWTILVVLVWQFAGLSMAFYLAGLQSIPEEIDEAAAVDGASTAYRLRRITFPLLAPAMTVSVTLTTIFGLRVFDQVLALTGGGPGTATETLATQVYKQTFLNGRFGYGAAFALLLTGLVAVVSITQVLVLRAREARV
jgi:raffinose/stachyose/melibiose transport system permease protein